MLEQLVLSNPETLQALLEKTQAELDMIQPEIDEVESHIAKLRELKLSKQRLLTLKMSLSTMLNTITTDNSFADNDAGLASILSENEAKLTSYNELSASKSFYPDQAFSEVENYLKHKNSLNYEMFKAVVFQGGKATTEEIKTFLVESGTKQPQSGESFEAIPLTEISSRANYLVRKGILQPLDRGSFYCTLGWKAADKD